MLRKTHNFLNFPMSLGVDCKISWNLSLMEKSEVQLDNDIEQSKAPQVIILWFGFGLGFFCLVGWLVRVVSGFFFFLKLGKDLILPLTPVFVFGGIPLTTGSKPKLSQFCFQ